MSFLTFLPLLLFTYWVNTLQDSTARIQHRLFAATVMLINLLSLILGLLIISSYFPQIPMSNGRLLLFTAILGLLCTRYEVRAQLARILPLDARSHLHIIALLGSLYLAALTFFTLNDQSLADLAAEATAVSIWEILGSGVALTATALIGTGLFSRRTFTEIAARLDLRWPQPRDFLIAAAWIIPMMILQIGMGLLNLTVDPQQLAAMDELGELLYLEIDTVWEWFLLAASAAIGEELLFRGALQPVLGIWFTAAVFAVTHLQYGYSPIMILIFMLGFILGRIKQRYGTSVAILVHFGYNFLLGLLALLAASIG